MSKISFRQGGSKRSAKRIAVIVIACVIGAVLLAAVALFAVLAIRSGQSQPQGETGLLGTYAPSSQTEYLARTFTDYFTEETSRELTEYDATEENIAGKYELYDAFGGKVSEFCGIWDGESEPETFRTEQLAAFQARYLYTEEAMAKVKFYLFLPAESYRFRVTGAEVGEENLSVTVEVLSDGDEAQTYTLTGTYQMDGNNGTAAYAQTELPPAILEFLQSFQYRSTVNDSNVYVNSLTFARQITLSR